MTPNPASFLHRTRRTTFKAGWLIAWVMLLMVVVQSSRGYTLAGDKSQFVQLCTQQGMVTVAMNQQSTDSTAMNMQGCDDCCGCCITTLGAPPVIQTAVRSIPTRHFIEVSADTQHLPTASFWPIPKPQPPPYILPLV